MKRIAALLILLCLLTGVSQAETITLLMHSDSGFQTQQTDMDRAAEAVNALLQEYGYDLRLEVTVSPVAKYRESQYGLPFKEQVMAFDLFFESVSTAQTLNLADSGMIMDLTELVQDSPLYDVFPQVLWNEVTLDGRIYALPLGWNMDSQGVFDSGIVLRMDILEELGLDIPRTLEELADLAQTAQDAGLPHEIAFAGYAPPRALHRTYAQWPFFVDNNSMFVIYPDGTLESYIHSDIFAQDAEALGSLQASGLLRFVVPYGEVTAMETWDFLAALWPIGFTTSTPNWEQIQLIQLEPERENFRMQPYCNTHVFISNDSPHPEAALALLEAIYTHQDIYDAFLYGVEGEDWILHEDGTVEILHELDNILRSFNMRRSYYGYEEVISLSNWPAPEETILDFPVAGFQYMPIDLARYQSAMSAMNAGANSMVLTRMGLQATDSYERAMEALRTKLDQVDYEGLVEEARDQYQRMLP